MKSFKNLGLSDQVLRAISDLGFEKPTEIQELTIPLLLEGNHDFIGRAQTGTGKTAAFGLPLLERIDPTNNATQALILAPTRELGQQIAGQLSLFSKYLKKVNVLAVYGGTNIVTQIKALRRPQHIIIATPGRLLDLIQRKSIKLNELRILVLDEADEMLNMGFKKDLDKILSYIPDDKLTWLFSATMSDEIRRIVKKYMDDPLEVRVNSKNEVNADIEHQYVIVTRANKTEALTRFIMVNPNMHGLVFCRTKRETQFLSDELQKKNYQADALHGDLSQRQRDRVMNRFKSHTLNLLIATDVAARGIDVNDITHVFHFTLPDDISYYTHRSGRTARAGKKGTSIAFINGREKMRIDRLKKLLNISFKKITIPNPTDTIATKIEDWYLQILNKKTKGKIDSELLEKVKTVFGNLSKDELIAKILMHEVEKYDTGSSKDLNEPKHEYKKNKKYSERRKRPFDRRRKKPKNRNFSKKRKR